MNMTRRSFLKAAGLTVVAAAGASMFTGCSTFIKPEITVTYQEVDATNTKQTATVITKGLKDWEKGKKVYTEDTSLFKVKDDTADISVDDAKTTLVKHLLDDGYTGAADDIKINTKAKTLSYNKKDSAHYELTVEFYKVG